MLLADLKGQRTLAAIVFTDGVSFSARMADDEEHTLKSIRRDFQLMTELCEQFEGQVIKTTGDGLLMYFTSGVQAVACAQEIQKALAASAAQMSPRDVLDHRIGIHLGDVFFSGTDVMGDGVNIAARLQAEAAPGGICISQTVYDVVKNRLALTATYLGPRELKNIQEAVPVYQLLLASQSERGGAIATVPPPAPKNLGTSSKQEVQNRHRLLAEVKHEVEARLSQSLHHAALTSLREASRQITRRIWDMEVKIGKQPSYKLPSWAKAIQVFDSKEIAGKLLVLGAPGAGKTTTLLELAGQLVTRAQKDAVQPIPVLLNLSSWRDDKQTIADWLVTELKLKYGVRVGISQQWLDRQQLLPLLDDLDEVETRQEQCIQAINQFLQDGRSQQIVVCCHRVEYVQSKTHLRLNGAIRLQPLSEEQIHQYLVSAERPELWHQLEADLRLMELAQSPLLLSMMTLVYQEPLQDWSQFSSIHQRRRCLYNAYVQTMLERTIKQHWYAPFKEPTAKQTLTWLVWLAKSLKQASQTEFLMSELQPHLLPTRTLWLYRMGIGLILGLILALYNGLIVGQSHGPMAGVIDGLIVTPLAVVAYGAIALSEGAIAKLIGGQDRRVISSLICGLLVGLVGGLTYKSIYSLFGPSDLAVQLITGSIYGLVGGLVVSLSDKIRTVESLVWSRTKAWEGMIIGAVVGLILGLTGMLTIKQSQEPIVVLLVGAIGLLMGGLISGLTGPEIERRIPNQRIWRSAVNAGSLALIGGLLGGLLDRLTGGCLWGLTVGAICGLIPGTACIQYFVLRSLLWLNGSIPWNYTRFLNYVTERLFLQRVGGRYRFIHNSLREHFAQMPLDS